jgi:succinyl-CoA synthetase beta subunit
MNIYEYQAKEILKPYDILIPQGSVVDNVEAGISVSEKMGFPLAIKAQVHMGGRGKSGGIKIVSNREDFKKQLSAILGMTIKGLKVKRVLIERGVDIKRQFYLAITVDRSKQKNIIMASGEGGIDIEETAKLYPEKIFKATIKKTDKLDEEEINNVISFLKLPESIKTQFQDTIKSLFNAYKNIDAQLLEINPLVVTNENMLIACDAKIIIDDNALFRHKDMNALKEEAEDNELEQEAHRRNLAYVKLQGDIGIIGNGAGLVMATMDEVKQSGGHPANFLDIGGGAKEEVMRNALEVIYMDKDIRGIFINIFGGITRCDEVARGIINVTSRMKRNIPIVLRLAGTKCEEGRALLTKSNLIYAESMEEGAKKITELVITRQM